MRPQIKCIQQIKSTPSTVYKTQSTISMTPFCTHRVRRLPFSALFAASCILIASILVQNVNCDKTQAHTRATISTSTPSPAIEKEALAKLRTIIKDEELNLDYMKKDAYLLAWLTKHKFDVELTAEKIRAALKWRKQHKVDNVLNEDFSVFQKNYPFDIEGVDRQGRPVWISQIGKWDIRRIVISGPQDKYDRYSLYLNELMSKKIRERREKNPDRRIFGTLVIIDLSGFNLRQHGCIRCMQQILKLDIEIEDAYSERPYKSLMINAPRIFDEFFHTVKSLSPEHPYQYEVYDFDQRKWQQVLLKYVDRDQLPTQYGGTRLTNLL